MERLRELLHAEPGLVGSRGGDGQTPVAAPLRASGACAGAGNDGHGGA